MTSTRFIEAHNAATAAKPIPARAKMSSVVLKELWTYLTTLPGDSELSFATFATTLRLILILPESLGPGDGSRAIWPERLLPRHGARAAAGWTAARAQATMAAHP